MVRERRVWNKQSLEKNSSKFLLFKGFTEKAPATYKYLLRLFCLMAYRMIDDLTSDVMFEATGKDLKELFSSAAQGLFSIICDRKDVKPASKREVHVKGKDLRETMINYLQALIAVVDTEEMFFSKFVITKAEETEVAAEAYGE